MKKIKFILLVLLVFCTGCSHSSIPEEKEKQVSEETQAPFEQDTCFKYHYEQLNERQQILYQEMYNIIFNIEEEGKISNKDVNDIKVVHEALIYDHPELFYVEMETVYDDYRLKPTYYFEKDEILTYREQLEEAKEDILADLPKKDTYEQMYYIYEYVINNVRYDENSQNNQLLISSMLNHETVCTGYAKMIQYLMQEIGVNTSLIVGGFFDENNQLQRHAWNMIEYDNDYYYIDATWGDDEENQMVLNEYFMFSSEDMLKFYTPETKYNTTSNLQNTYFIKNNLYFEQYDISLLLKAVNKEDRTMLLRFSEDIYPNAKNRLTQTNDVFDILTKAGIEEEYINYSCDDRFQVIKVMW